MIRTRQITDLELVKWRKLGGGSLRILGKIIKPGQVFSARLEDIPKAFRKSVVPVDGTIIVEEKVVIPAIIKAKTPVYTTKARENSKVWFDIIDPNGKIFNEKALKKEAAEALLNDLNQ